MHLLGFLLSNASCLLAFSDSNSPDKASGEGPGVVEVKWEGAVRLSYGCKGHESCPGLSWRGGVLAHGSYQCSVEGAWTLHRWHSGRLPIGRWPLSFSPTLSPPRERLAVTHSPLDVPLCLSLSGFWNRLFEWGS